MFAESVKAHRAIGSRSMIPWWAGLVTSVLNRDEAEVPLSTASPDRGDRRALVRSRHSSGARRGGLAAR